MQTQRHAAGRAKFAPTISLVAKKDGQHVFPTESEEKKGLLISHQTGTTMLTLLPQINASTAYIKFITKSHPIIERVATFLARQCHGSGRKSDRAAMIAIGPNSGWTADNMMRRGYVKGICQGSYERKKVKSASKYLNHLVDYYMRES